MAKIGPLDWDSNLFGYPVARLDLGTDVFEYSSVSEELAKYRLTYVVSNIEQQSTFLTAGDSKVVFCKRTEHRSVDPSVIDSPEEILNELIVIGKQSGSLSRFRLDSNFKNQEFHNLYRIWMEKSIRKERSFYNPTIMMEGSPSGIITLGGTDERTATIGLFAVAEPFRGRGIGKKLLIAADNAAKEKGYDQLTVATQGKNIVAQNVYKGFGFQELKSTYIYNCWNEAFTV